MRFAIALAGAVLAVVLVGCSHPLKKTDFLAPSLAFDRVDTSAYQVGVAEEPDLSIDGHFLTKVEMRELAEDGKPLPDLKALGLDTTNVQPTLFIVPEPEWRVGKVNLNQAEIDDIRFTIRERLYRYLLREYPHPVRVRYAYVPEDPLVTGYRVLTLQTAVTHVKTGWGPARYFLGYGAGGTTLQLEGRFVDDSPEQNPVAWFRIREDHGGYPMGFLNPRVFSATYCLKYASDKVIRKLTDDIRQTVPGFRPRPVGEAMIDKHLAGRLAPPSKYPTRPPEWPNDQPAPPAETNE